MQIQLSLTHPWHLSCNSTLDGNSLCFKSIIINTYSKIKKRCASCNTDLGLDKIDVENLLSHSVLNLSARYSAKSRGISVLDADDSAHILGLTSMK